jgi:hypothetical protein
VRFPAGIDPRRVRTGRRPGGQARAGGLDCRSTGSRRMPFAALGGFSLFGRAPRVTPVPFFPAFGHRLRRVAGTALAIALLAGGVLPASADDALQTRSRALETEAFGLLLDQFNLEESLLAPDNDRLTVFLSVPHGSRMVLNQVVLYLNGKPVVTHRYSVDELQRFLGEATQLLYMTRIPQGRHSLRLEVKVLQGIVQPMQNYTLNKGRSAKFVDLQIAGELAREIVVSEW